MAKVCASELSSSSIPRARAAEIAHLRPGFIPGFPRDLTEPHSPGSGRDRSAAGDWRAGTVKADELRNRYVNSDWLALP